MKNKFKKALVLLLALVTAFSTLAFAGCDKLQELISPTKPPAVEQPSEPDEPTEPETPDEPTDVNKPLSMPRTMTFTAPIAEDENPGVLIEAIITPEWASNKELDWTVEFTPADSAQQSWLTQYQILDSGYIGNYVTVTPTADGAATAYVKCLDVFECQITLTATLRYDTSISAACTLDYAQKLSDLQSMTKRYSDGTQVMNGSGRNPQEYGFGIGTSDDTIRYKSSASRMLFFEKMDLAFNGGTINSEVLEQKMYLRYSEELKAAFAEYGLNVTKDGSEIFFTTYGEDLEQTQATDVSGSEFTFSLLFGITSFADNNWVKLRDALASIDTSIAPLQLVYTITTNYETREFARDIKIDTASMIPVESVTLNNSTLIF